MPKKPRSANSNVRYLSILWTQEKKISTKKNMIGLYDVSWYPRFVPEVDRPGLNRVSTHVREKGKT